MFYKGVNKTFWGRVVEIINCTNIRAVIHSIQIQAIEIVFSIVSQSVVVLLKKTISPQTDLNSFCSHISFSQHLFSIDFSFKINST